MLTLVPFTCYENTCTLSPLAIVCPRITCQTVYKTQTVVYSLRIPQRYMDLVNMTKKKSEKNSLALQVNTWLLLMWYEMFIWGTLRDLVPFMQFKKVKIAHECLTVSKIVNCTNGTKSCNASHIIIKVYFSLIYQYFCYAI